MPSQTANDSHHGTPSGHRRANSKISGGRSATSSRDELRPSRDMSAQRAAQDVEGLKEYQLGDCLGKGAFGSVYRALNWGTGETVAIKQIKMSEMPKGELKAIMSEIDLLKNLEHANIVKYHGFQKAPDSLYIILEYCENGSLHSICKNFGKFPENLVALYMSQVLQGLRYLHEQGVIHRDIKGANILTTKEGLVKLADFGVATKAAGQDESVVGTPYWMAPEVIELQGAREESDIWSVGCTVIELIEGKPPYHKLNPMQALFRIVNDEHPPIPASASPSLQSFLMSCFQKHIPNRLTAQRAQSHSWITSAKRSTPAAIPLKPIKFDEAVLEVREWNEATKSPGNDSLRRSVINNVPSGLALGARHAPPQAQTKSTAALKPLITAPKPRPSADSFRSPEIDEGDNWDNDFISVTPGALQLSRARPQDNFGGKLSADKLKAYARPTESILEESQFDDFADSDLTIKNPSRQVSADFSMDTVRPSPSVPTKSQPSRPSRRKSSVTEPKTALFRGIPVTKTRVSGGRPSNFFRENSVEDYSDLLGDDEAFHRKIQAMQAEAEDSFSPKLFHPSDLKSAPRSTQRTEQSSSLRSRAPSTEKASRKIQRSQSDVDLETFAEDANDADFSDMFSPRDNSETGSEVSTLAINSKMSSSWLAGEDEESDPFAQLEESLDANLESNVARDRDARLYQQTEDLVGRLKTSQPEELLLDLTDELLAVLAESPKKRDVILRSHGMLPILEILGSKPHPDISLRLLKIVNQIILESVEAQESLCFIGGIPILTSFSDKKYSSEIRKESAAFVRQMCQTSTLTLQMFIGCGGLNVLVEFLEEDFDSERDLVLIGVNGVWSVFELQGPTPKNDFCRIFSRHSVLQPLSLTLNRVLLEKDEISRLVSSRIVNIFLLFSQAENHVKELVADRKVLKRVLGDLHRMSSSQLITMLKFIKNLSMLASTHESLESSNAIDTLTELLRTSRNRRQFREISNQILNTMYNLCRLNKARQEEAALQNIVPLLMDIVQTEWPLKEFALPILCDMAHSGKVCRKKLWETRGLQFYMSLLADRYWQVTALDAIHIWLQEETARVEQTLLLDGRFTRAIVACFANPEAGPDAFENLLEPLSKLLFLSPPVAASLALPEFFERLVEKLTAKKTSIRLNLLRILRCVCESTEEQGGLLRIHGLYHLVQDLAYTDGAVLVREIAEQLLKLADEESTPMTPSRLRPASSGRGASTSSLTPPTPTASKGRRSQRQMTTQAGRPNPVLHQSQSMKSTSATHSPAVPSLVHSASNPVPAIPMVYRRESLSDTLFEPSATNSPNTATRYDSRISASSASATPYRSSASYRPTSRDANSGGSTHSIWSATSGNSGGSITSLSASSSTRSQITPLITQPRRESVSKLPQRPKRPSLVPSLSSSAHTQRREENTSPPDTLAARPSSRGKLSSTATGPTAPTPPHSSAKLMVKRRRQTSTGVGGSSSTSSLSSTSTATPPPPLPAGRSDTGGKGQRHVS